MAHAFPSYGRPSPPPRYTSTSCVPGPCEGRWLSRLHVQAISHTDIDSISVGHVMTHVHLRHESRSRNGAEFLSVRTCFAVKDDYPDTL